MKKIIENLRKKALQGDVATDETDMATQGHHYCLLKAKLELQGGDIKK